MIQANELRIGNWVNDKSVGYVQVNWLTFHPDNLKNTEPIPLTPEILENAGFEALDHGARDTSFCRNNFFLRWYVIEEVVRYEGREIKYLHQLQNLYFALVGEELKVELCK